MDFHLNSLLNLPNARVFTCYKKAGFTFIHLDLINEGINCPNCENYTNTIQKTSQRLIRDLSIVGTGVYLKVPRRKFYCGQCQKYPTERLEWVENRQRFTQRYQEYIYKRVKESSCEQVSRNEELSSAQESANIEQGCRERAKKKRMRFGGEVSSPEERTKQDWGLPEKLNLDEFSRRKGKGRFATVLSIHR